MGDNVGQNFPSKDHLFIEKIAKLRDTRVNDESETVSRSNQRVPSIYIEARRHLSDMLINGHEEVGSSFGVKSPRTLARILALSEFNSPIPSPRMNSVQSITMTPMRSSGYKNDLIEKVSENEDQMIVEGNGAEDMRADGE
ncbi:hypothetical protein SAY87_012787 [Trapa incisa]|uniref:Uncharacterized protein n=1 Tax=Trapa incisa TaxID=236973 RepID=A0AAN7GR21_9MYRT|nr:hypothetical protein SAY87_012787 [Trapa incisa]